MRKKILLLSIFSLGYLVNSFAQATSNFVIFSEDASLFYVIMNGIKQNVEPKSNVKITGLTNPNNQVTIVFANEKLGSVKKNIWFPEMGMEATAKITKTKKGMKLRYFGEVPIASAPATNAWTTTYSTSEPTSNVGTSTSTNTSNTNTSNNGTTTSGTTGNGTTWNTNSNTNTSTSTSTTSNTTSNTTGNLPVETNNTVTTNSSSTNTSNSGNAVDMNYMWKAGTFYQFSAIQTDNVATSMMGMSMKDQFKTTTDFGLYISNVTPQGEASGMLYLLNFNVVDSKNHVLASINDIPKSAIQSEVKVDKKGKFTFAKKIMLITTDTGNVLAYGKADGNSMTVGGQAGNMQVDAYAEFDPKTGNLKAGYNVKEIKTTKKVSVTVNENTDMIDVLPYDYLELLALPEGSVAQGDKATMRAGLYNIDVTTTSIANGLASLNYKMSTNKSNDMFTGNANTQSGTDGNGMNVSTEGFGDMGNIEMTGEDKEAMDMMKGMTPDMTCDITSSFNYATGMFDQVSGTMNTTMDAMGMKMEVKSFLQMKKL